MFKTRAGGQRLFKQCKKLQYWLGQASLSEKTYLKVEGRGLFSKEEWLSRFRKCCGAPSGYKWNESSLEEESSSTTCRNRANNKKIFFLHYFLHFSNFAMDFCDYWRRWFWILSAMLNLKSSRNLQPEVNNFSRSPTYKSNTRRTGPLWPEKEKDGTKSDHIPYLKVHQMAFTQAMFCRMFVSDWIHFISIQLNLKSSRNRLGSK